MKIERAWAMPNRNTFSVKPIRDFILEELPEGTIIDPFANSCKIADITNDLDPQYDTDYHLDALDFLKTFVPESVDMVLFDPPYTPRQVAEVYKKLGKTVDMETTQMSYWSKLKTEIARITKPNGKCLSFGWNSSGVGKKNGFKIERILIVCHGSQHNDTICVADRKVQCGLTAFSKSLRIDQK